MTRQTEAFLRQADVSRETFERLQIYAGLLEKWTARINLVAKSTLPDLWSRHMLDSMQVFDLGPSAASHWADLGSGGGFPGAVVAIVAAEKRPNLRVTLVESDQRKATFLRAVARQTGAAFDVIADRIELVPPLGVDVVSARALAPLSQLLEHAHRHLSKGGVAIFPKGATAKKELAVALESWRFRCDTYPSQTDEEAVVLKIGDIERV